MKEGSVSRLSYTLLHEVDFFPLVGYNGWTRPSTSRDERSPSPRRSRWYKGSERVLPRERIFRFVDPVVPELARHPVNLKLVSSRPPLLGGLTRSRCLLERLALQVLDAFRQTQGTKLAGFTQRSPRRLLKEHPRLAEELVGPPSHADSLRVRFFFNRGGTRSQNLKMAPARPGSPSVPWPGGRRVRDVRGDAWETNRRFRASVRPRRAV